jgi:hypothetical protein
MIRRPLLPLGRWAPWVLATMALALLAAGLVTGDDGLLLVGCVAGAAWVLAFPLARLLLGKDRHDGE